MDLDVAAAAAAHGPVQVMRKGMERREFFKTVTASTVGFVLLGDNRFAEPLTDGKWKEAEPEKDVNKQPLEFLVARMLCSLGEKLNWLDTKLTTDEPPHRWNPETMMPEVDAIWIMSAFHTYPSVEELCEDISGQLAMKIREDLCGRCKAEVYHVPGHFLPGIVQQTLIDREQQLCLRGTRMMRSPNESKDGKARLQTDFDIMLRGVE
jgi:hypothetical protein